MSNEIEEETTEVTREFLKPPKKRAMHVTKCYMITHSKEEFNALVAKAAFEAWKAENPDKDECEYSPTPEQLLAYKETPEWAATEVEFQAILDEHKVEMAEFKQTYPEDYAEHVRLLKVAKEAKLAKEAREERSESKGSKSKSSGKKSKRVKVSAESDVQIEDIESCKNEGIRLQMLNLMEVNKLNNSVLHYLINSNQE